MKREYLLVLIIFLAGFLIRIFSVLPYNTIVGFDQARDLFSATEIFRDHNIAIIGPTAGNNPNLHHGVAYWYYMILPLIITKGNPVGVVVWNSFFNALTIAILYFFAKDLFKSKKIGVIAAVVAATSYQLVQYSGWLSNPTVSIFTVPVFFYALWKYYLSSLEGVRRNYWLPVAFLFLGLSIAFELFFIYLIPVGIILFILLKIKWPSIKNLLFSIILFCLPTSTMIATEIKFNFSGIKSILSAGSYVGASKLGFFELVSSFLQKWESFYLNYVPQFPQPGKIIAMLSVLFLVYEIIKNRKNKKERDRFVFLAVFLFSPAVMLFLGTHNAPWFLIGRPAAAILAFAFLLSKAKKNFLIISLVILIAVANIFASVSAYGRGQILLEPDPSSILSNQISAIDYTYQETRGLPFEINTLTNPLYVNAVWAYHYYWYGKARYGYLPSFAGGEQLSPYNTLQKPDGGEKLLYLLMDTSPRIPPQYKMEIINSAEKISSLVEKKIFGGVEVQKRLLKNSFDK